MKLRDTQANILASIERSHPEVRVALRVAREAAGKGKLLEWQAAALYALAWRQCHALGGRILEIGTFLGYSAAVMAQAAPKTQITTLNPAGHEAAAARRNLRAWPHVEVIERRSWDYLAECGDAYDLIFVDGDHNAIARDLPWFNELRVGGLILFHDYTPLGAPSQSPIVYQALTAIAERRGGFDVLVVDEQQIGLAGFYRREGETW